MNDNRSFDECEKTCANITSCEHGCIGYRNKQPVEISPAMVQSFVLLSRGATLVDAVDEEMRE